MSQKVEGRLAYADLLRVLATLAVIVLHISTGWLSSTSVGSSDWTVLCTYDALMRWCVPMFVMLSGMFLLDPKKPVPLRSIFFKYILRTLAALLVWGIFYALLGYGHVQGRFTWAGIKIAFSYVLHAQTHYHLWFLYMIIGLYLVTPILRAFVKGASKAEFHWFFLLTFLVYSVFPVLQELFPNRMALPMTWLNQFDIHMVLGYVGYYVAGYYLKHYTLSRLAEFIIYILGILGGVITVWGNAALSIRYGAFNGVLFEHRAPNVVFMTVAIFVLFRYVLGVSEERSRRQRLGGVAKVSFGIFLVHDFFIMCLRLLDISTLSFSPILSVPVLAGVVFLLSFAAAWLLSKIPFIGPYLT